MPQLWQGRSSKAVDSRVNDFNSSIRFDARMIEQDIHGSMVHSAMLGKQGIVSNEEKDQIIAGLEAIRKDIADGKIVFNAESDALIVKGIIALLIKVLSGHTPDEILNADLYFIDKIGLREHLSPTRSNGLLSMVKQIRMYALAFKAKEGK